MRKCYFLCNIQTTNSDYIISNYAGSNLALYVGECLRDYFNVVIINVGAPTKGHVLKALNQYKYEGMDIIEFPSGNAFLPTRIRAQIMLLGAMKYLLKNAKKDDKILIYHSISFGKYYKKVLNAYGLYNSILLIAEFYSEVGNIKFDVNKEIKMCRMFNKFILMSSGIKERIISDDIEKKCIFIYGVYRPVKLLARIKDDDRIHLVYAGTSSRIKGGLFNSLKAMKYLPDNFMLHVFCIADQNTTEEIRTNKNTVYEGYIDEISLSRLLQNYDIGLATQNPDLSFNTSSFPSKIINYLSCGLSVVSSDSISVRNSPVGDYVFFYEGQKGEKMAEAIIQASREINRERNVLYIRILDENFRREIGSLFNQN